MKMHLLGVATALLVGTAAHAADLYQPEPLPPLAAAPEVQVSEVSGWYLRGDVGYDFNHMRGAKYFQGGNDNQTGFDSTKLDDSFNLGVGVGYQMNHYLRGDLTFDYMTSADFRGSTSSAGGADVGTACAGACTSTDISSMKAYALMANAYVDLGTYGAITPYIGGGIGGAYVKWDNLKNTSCADDGSVCDDTVTHRGKGSWRFAYQLMAGAAIDVTCNVKADVGYRYRHISGGDMFGFAESGGPGYDKGFDSHEIRAGARYTFGGCAEPAYEPPPEPIVYK